MIFIFIPQSPQGLRVSFRIPLPTRVLLSCRVRVRGRLGGGQDKTSQRPHLASLSLACRSSGRWTVSKKGEWFCGSGKRMSGSGLPRWSRGKWFLRPDERLGQTQMDSSLVPMNRPLTVILSLVEGGGQPTSNEPASMPIGHTLKRIGATRRSLRPSYPLGLHCASDRIIGL